jgi:SsrA-binding protein
LQDAERIEGRASPRTSGGVEGHDALGAPRFREPTGDDAAVGTKNAPNEAAKIEVVATNRRATFDYELITRYEAGISLLGSEVKMLRQGKADLTDGWVSVDRGEAFLRGVNIPVMQGSPYSHEAKRTRKLLLNMREIEQLMSGTTREGMTVTVTKLYFKNGKLKAEIALARGKKTYDKRESLKEKDAEREAKQAMRRSQKGSR